MINLENYIIRLNQLDNVVTVIKDIAPENYSFNGCVIEIKQGVERGFKIAVGSISKGEKLYKYGQPIGVASADIRPGELVHIHNLKSLI